MSGCLNFDPEARRILYEKYSAQMYSICLRYSKNRETADDIFQQAFYLVYKNLEQLKNTDALSGWIKTIFVNTALKQINSTKLSTSIDIDEISETHVPGDWNNALSNLGTDELTTFIQQLPSGCRTIFNMYIIDGYSHKEIAQKLDISIGTSKSQLHDARKWLQKKIISNTKVIHI